MNLLRMGLVFAVLEKAQESRHCLRQASLLYLRSGREDYAADVKGAMARLKTTGLFPDEAFELDMDALFEVPPNPEALAALSTLRPRLLEPDLVNSLMATQAAHVGFECTVGRQWKFEGLGAGAVRAGAAFDAGIA
jgi:hypothetical protein